MHSKILQDMVLAKFVMISEPKRLIFHLNQVRHLMFCKEFSTKFVLAPRMIGLAIYYIVLNQISSPYLNSFFFSDSNGKSGKCTFLTREESGTQCGKTRILLSFEKYFVKPIFSEPHAWYGK